MKRVNLSQFFEDFQDWHRYRDSPWYYLRRESRSNYAYKHIFAVIILPERTVNGFVRVNTVFVCRPSAPHAVPRPFLYTMEYDK